jgi:hypothetical protein
LTLPPFQKFLEQRVALGLCGGCGLLVGVLGRRPGVHWSMLLGDERCHIRAASDAG